MGESYDVHTVAQSMTFHYTPKVTVLASDTEEAKEKAIQKVSRDMMIDRSLIRVSKVELS